MRRGTTPLYTLTVDTDLTGWTCYVTLKGSGSKLDLEGERLTVSATPASGSTPASSTVQFELTQKETLAFKPGKCGINLRAIKNGQAIATDIVEIDVQNVLKDGEIHE